MSKNRSTAKTAAKDAVELTVELVVVTPVCWVLRNTLGRLVDAT